MGVLGLRESIRALGLHKDEKVLPPQLTYFDRMSSVRHAFEGAAHGDQVRMARVVMGMLRPQDMEALVRELDREIWMEKKP